METLVTPTHKRNLLYAQQPPTNPAAMPALFHFIPVLDTNYFLQLIVSKKYPALFFIQAGFWFYTGEGSPFFETGLSIQFLHPHFCRHVLHTGGSYAILLLHFKKTKSHSCVDGKSVCVCSNCVRCTNRFVHEFFCKGKFCRTAAVYVHGVLLAVHYYQRPTDNKTKKYPFAQKLDDQELQYGHDGCYFSSVPYSFLLLRCRSSAQL